MRYLTPKDLLSLARTTKSLRAFLMSRNSRLFWKTARRNMEDLPPCPADLSEPAYANLLFDSHCHVSIVEDTYDKLSFDPLLTELPEEEV